jgi:ankyrin repeat protein
LHWAARSKHAEAVQLLLTKSPLINAQNKMGDTPLHSACWGGSLDVVKLLIGVAGIKCDIKNKNKESPINLAKNDDVAAFLMQYTGQKTNAQDLLDDED